MDKLKKLLIPYTLHVLIKRKYTFINDETGVQQRRRYTSCICRQKILIIYLPWDTVLYFINIVFFPFSTLVVRDFLYHCICFSYSSIGRQSFLWIRELKKLTSQLKEVVVVEEGEGGLVYDSTTRGLYAPVCEITVLLITCFHL